MTDVEKANAKPEYIKKARGQIMSLPWSIRDIENTYKFVEHVDRIILSAIHDSHDEIVDAARALVSADSVTGENLAALRDAVAALDAKKE